MSRGDAIAMVARCMLRQRGRRPAEVPLPRPDEQLGLDLGPGHTSRVVATGTEVLRWLTTAVERDLRARPAEAAAHVPDFSVFDKATGRVLCRRCDRMISAQGWTMPCPGRPQ